MTSVLVSTLGLLLVMVSAIEEYYGNDDDADSYLQLYDTFDDFEEFWYSDDLWDSAASLIAADHSKYEMKCNDAVQLCFCQDQLDGTMHQCRQTAAHSARDINELNIDDYFEEQEEYNDYSNYNEYDDYNNDNALEIRREDLAKAIEEEYYDDYAEEQELQYDDYYTDDATLKENFARAIDEEYYAEYVDDEEAQDYYIDDEAALDLLQQELENLDREINEKYYDDGEDDHEDFVEYS